MSTEPRKHGWMWSASLFVALMLGYVASYFMAGNYVAQPGACVRVYRSATVARLFMPVAWMEANTRRKPVILYHAEQGPGGIPRMVGIYEAKP